MTDQIKIEEAQFLVVASNNQWAADSLLSDAIRKAGMREESPQDACAWNLQFCLQDGREPDWDDVFEDFVDAGHSHQAERPIDFVAYYLDPELWTGFSVSDFDGSVILSGFKGDPNDKVKAAHDAMLYATWVGGRIVKRELNMDEAA